MSALQNVGMWHTRLAVRLGQTDPLVEALKDASRALEGIAPDLAEDSHTRASS